MARTKKWIEVIDRHNGIVLEEVTETTTLRQNLPNGGVIRTDGRGFWICNNVPSTPFRSFYGTSPSEWDRTRAYYEDFSRSYEMEADYS